MIARWKCVACVLMTTWTYVLVFVALDLRNMTPMFEDLQKPIPMLSTDVPEQGCLILQVCGGRHCLTPACSAPSFNQGKKNIDALSK